jgi:hypothetical protein
VKHYSRATALELQYELEMQNQLNQEIREIEQRLVVTFKKQHVLANYRSFAPDIICIEKFHCTTAARVSCSSI